MLNTCMSHVLAICGQCRLNFGRDLHNRISERKLAKLNVCGVEDTASCNQGLPRSKLNQVRISMTWRMVLTEGKRAEFSIGNLHPIKESYKKTNKARSVRSYSG